MNQARQALKNNKKLRVFLLFLILAFIFWMLIKLSRTYTSSVDVKLSYIDLPANKMLQNEPLSKIKVNLKAVGFSLLRHKFTKNKATISLKNVKPRRGSTYYYTSSDVLLDIGKSFTKSEVLGIYPDTLYFDFGRSVSKKVKVEPDVSIQYKSGYNLSGKLQVTPEYITVSGPKKLVDSVIFVQTENVKLTNIYDTIHKKLVIKGINNKSKLTFSATEVMIKGKVEKFTERTIEVSVKLVNVPSGYEVNMIPEKVKAKFQIGLSDFNKVSENDFEIICDYQRTKEEGIDFLIPEVKNSPTFANSLKIIPNKIEFLLEK